MILKIFCNECKSILDVDHGHTNSDGILEIFVKPCIFSQCPITDKFYECPNCQGRNPTIDINIPIAICDDCGHNREISKEWHELLKKDEKVKVINLDDDDASYASYYKKHMDKKGEKK